MRIEVQVAADDAADTESSDRDHLLEVHEILERVDLEDENDPLYVRKCFDLCEECRAAIVENPLSSPKPLHNLPFSAN